MGVVTTGEVARTYWWLVLIRGIVALLFGIVAIGWTHIAILFLIYLLGAYFLVDGIMGVISGFPGATCLFTLVVDFDRRNHRYHSCIYGLLLAWWSCSCADLPHRRLGYHHRHYRDNRCLLCVHWFGLEWSLVVGGALSVILGIIVFFIPVTAILTFVWLLGVFAIIYGIVLLVRAFQFRALLKA